MSDEQYITESYLRRKIEGIAFGKVGAILSNLCWNDYNFGTNLDYWSPDNYIDITWRNARMLRFTITDRFYRPGGDIERGDPKSVDNETGTTGEYTSIRNHGNTVIEHQVDKTVTLEHSRSSSLSKGITLDLTSKESAGYGGVSVELEQHLGVSVDSEEAESSTTTTTTTFSDTVEINPGDEVAIVFKKGTKRYKEDFILNALSDCGFKLEINEWDGSSYMGPHAILLSSKHNRGIWDWKHSPHWGTHFNSIHDFCGFVRGYDVRAPNMHYYMKSASDKAKAALAELEDAEILRLQLAGSNTIIAEGDADYSVVDITGINDDDVKDRYGEPGNPVGDTLRLVPTKGYCGEEQVRHIADYPARRTVYRRALLQAHENC